MSKLKEKTANTQKQSDSFSKVSLKRRSKRYKENFFLLQKAIKDQGSRIFTFEKAIDLLYQMKHVKFKNGITVELHCNLNIDPTKSDQLVRGSLLLPYGTGKKLKIAAFVTPEKVEIAKKLGAYKAGGEDLIEEIKQEGKVDFDLAIAQPELMKKLPAIARILGTAGVMPNPKTGTVDENIEQILKEFINGKINFKNDKTGNLHLPFGKINSEFTREKLLENLKAVLEMVEKSRPEVVKKKFINSVYIVANMCPAIQII